MHDVKTVELTPEQRERVLRYLDTVDIAVSGQGGSDPTYRFANVLLWGFALTIEQARTFMLIYSAKCKPPWSMEEIEHKLADALKADQSGKPRGYLWGKESVEEDMTIVRRRHGFRRKPSTSPRISTSRLSLRKGGRTVRLCSRPERFPSGCRECG